MGQVQVMIDGKPYRMACDDGQEKHLQGLAAKLNSKMLEMKHAFGEIGDMRLGVMAAITLADELSEANERLSHMEQEIARLSAQHTHLETGVSGRDIQIAQTIAALSERVERIVKSM